MLTPLAARTAGAAGAMLHDLRVVRQIGVNDEIKVRQINARAATSVATQTASATIAQGLQRLGSLVLRQFPDRATTEKPRSRSVACQMAAPRFACCRTPARSAIQRIAAR